MEEELASFVGSAVSQHSIGVTDNSDVKAYGKTVDSYQSPMRDLLSDLAESARGKVEKKANVSFMTTLDRELFPTKMPRNRFGNEISPLRGAPHRGPGCYENEDKTNFWYEIEHKINSTKGYTLGARTGSRFRKENLYQTPSPTAYQTRCTEELEFDTSKKPFLVGADRFPVYRRDITEVLPGAGAYEHDLRRNRKVHWHQSFGGSPVLMPSIKVRSIIDQNTDKLYSTKEEKKYNRKLAYLKLYYN